MGCDMVVALGRSTANGRSLFGQNTGRSGQERQRLHRTAAREFTPGEKLCIGPVEIPQVRSILTVIGSQADGMWGYHHGLNEMHVAIGCTHLRTRLGDGAVGLRATDLVRLALERSNSARQAVDWIADLLARHGQVPGNGGAGTDGAFLVADGNEAYAIETSGRYWVLQELREVRAMSDCCTIRQDWDRIAPGLASQAIGRQWWPEDGSKLDFAGALATAGAGVSAAMRRWARATYLLQQHNGAADLLVFRTLLSDHFENVVDVGTSAKPVPLCQHGESAADMRTAMSLIAELDPKSEAPAQAWCSFGPPCIGVYLPVFLAGALPGSFTDGSLDLLARSQWSHAERATAREQAARLQEQFDQQAEDFRREAAEFLHQGQMPELQRQATLFHQHILESFEKMFDGLAGEPQAAPDTVGVW